MKRNEHGCGLRIIGGADVRRLMSPESCIDLIERAMRTVSSGGAQLPLRTVMTLPDGANLFAVMPGFLSDPPALGAKVIAVYPGNPSRGLSSHTGVVLLFDPVSGRPLAVIDAAEVTALRTAAATAVATRALARPNARVLAILGTGEQARAHLHALKHVRALQSVRIWGRTPEKARALAEQESAALGVPIVVSATVQEAVSGADIVCTTTSSREPILHGEWVEPGTHVNLIGASTAAAREVDDELVVKSRFFVDFRPSALAQAGELRSAIAAGLVDESHIVGEIGAVLNGSVSGRIRESEVTVYKSLGIAAQDLAMAYAVYEKAVRDDVGVTARL